MIATTDYLSCINPLMCLTACTKIGSMIQNTEYRSYRRPLAAFQGGNGRGSDDPLFWRFGKGNF